MEKEFLDFEQKNEWNTVFKQIGKNSLNFSHSFNCALKPENLNLNRYTDIKPFDHSRVKLKRNGIDYINASFVKVKAAKRSYILTQGPLASTTGHFWLMVWEQKSTAIVMLNLVIDSNGERCHQYWPEDNERKGVDSLLLNDVNLMVTIIEEHDFTHYVIRKFILTDLMSLKSRNVLQFQYTTWPEYGVPKSPNPFLKFLFAVRKSGVLNNNVGPSVVHCSAGVGRSGTFCLVDSCLNIIERKGDSNSINIRQQLLEMRYYRKGLIQTAEQLKFAYHAIIEGAKTEKKQKDFKLFQRLNSVFEFSISFVFITVLGLIVSYKRFNN